MLGLSIAVLATVGTFHFANVARAASDSPLAKAALVLAWIDATALIAAAFGVFG